MAIGKISGQMLQSDLVRQGVDLSIDSTLVYFDVANRRVGFNTVTPNNAVSVDGNVNAQYYFGIIGTADQPLITNVGALGNLTVTGNLTVGNISINGITGNTISLSGDIISTAGNIRANLGQVSGNTITGNTVTAETLTVTGNTNLGNLTFSNTTVSTTFADGNIYLAPSGTGTVYFQSTNGIVLPIGNTAQQPSYLPAGGFRFNSDSVTPEYFNGIAWVPVSTSVSYQTFNGNSTGNTFPLNQSTTTGGVLVNLNGVQQTPNVAYAVANSSITFAEIPLTTDVIDIRYIATGQATSNYGNASVADYLPTYTGNLGGTVNGYSIGYKDIPQLSTGNANITLAAADSGKHYLSTTTAANIIYLPTNASVPLPLGSVITVVVQGTGSVQIVANTGVTLYMGGNATSGSNIRTISSYGVASVLKTETNTWFINGTGVS